MWKTLVLILVLSAITDAGRGRGPMKTECQVHRNKELRSKSQLPMRIIPDCDDDGDYKALQCFNNSGFCTCWQKDGVPVTQPSEKLRNCNCPLQRDYALKRIRPGVFVPRCEEDGSFSKRQCSASTGFCWCANPFDGMQLGRAARGLMKCD